MSQRKSIFIYTLIITYYFDNLSHAASNKHKLLSAMDEFLLNVGSNEQKKMQGYLAQVPIAEKLEAREKIASNLVGALNLVEKYMNCEITKLVGDTLFERCEHIKESILKITTLHDDWKRLVYTKDPVKMAEFQEKFTKLLEEQIQTKEHKSPANDSSGSKSHPLLEMAKYRASNVKVDQKDLEKFNNDLSNLSIEINGEDSSAGERKSLRPLFELLRDAAKELENVKGTNGGKNEEAKEKSMAKKMAEKFDGFEKKLLEMLGNIINKEESKNLKNNELFKKELESENVKKILARIGFKYPPSLRSRRNIQMEQNNIQMVQSVLINGSFVTIIVCIATLPVGGLPVCGPVIIVSIIVIVIGNLLQVILIIIVAVLFGAFAIVAAPIILIGELVIFLHKKIG